MNGSPVAMAEQALATILERLTFGQEALRRQQEDQQTLMMGLVEAAQRAAAPRPEPCRVVDVKGLGRPSPHSGSSEEWTP